MLLLSMASCLNVLKASPSDLPLDQILKVTEAFLVRHGVTWREVRWWDRSAFDMKKFQHIFEVSLNLGPYPPWSYTEVWGIETLLKYTSKEQSRYGSIHPKNDVIPLFIYHSAMHDSALDCHRFYKLFQEG